MGGRCQSKLDKEISGDLADLLNGTDRKTDDAQ
jgi:hypothetical protein